ncbi:MAG: DUF4397 domain-containing protein [Chitinophagaceae bacterium]|nr:DUF4397 domain-containing protein [Chitinophagaceae bacterium]
MKPSIIKHCLLLSFIISATGGCKKESPAEYPLASLKIVNTITGGQIAKLNSDPSQIWPAWYENFSLNAGDADLYVWPETDSLHPYYVSNKTKLEPSGLYTLFLGGTPEEPASIFVKESFPSRTDSTAAIRFINFSPNGPAVNVTLSTSPDVNEFFNVAYNAITEFKLFPATSANTEYVFEVRDAGTNEVLASLPMSGIDMWGFVPRFRYVTLVFYGNVGETLGISRINHYNIP